RLLAPVRRRRTHRVGREHAGRARTRRAADQQQVRPVVFVETRAADRGFEPRNRRQVRKRFRRERTDRAVTAHGVCPAVGGVVFGVDGAEEDVVCPPPVAGAALCAGGDSTGAVGEGGGGVLALPAPVPIGNGKGGGVCPGGAAASGVGCGAS